MSGWSSNWGLLESGCRFNCKTVLYGFIPVFDYEVQIPLFAVSAYILKLMLLWGQLWFWMNVSTQYFGIKKAKKVIFCVLYRGHGLTFSCVAIAAANWKPIAKALAIEPLLLFMLSNWGGLLLSKQIVQMLLEHWSLLLPGAAETKRKQGLSILDSYLWVQIFAHAQVEEKRP